MNSKKIKLTGIIKYTVTYTDVEFDFKFEDGSLNETQELRSNLPCAQILVPFNRPFGDKMFLFWVENGYKTTMPLN